MDKMSGEKGFFSCLLWWPWDVRSELRKYAAYEFSELLFDRAAMYYKSENLPSLLLSKVLSFSSRGCLEVRPWFEFW